MRYIFFIIFIYTTIFAIQELQEEKQGLLIHSKEALYLAKSKEIKKDLLQLIQEKEEHTLTITLGLSQDQAIFEALQNNNPDLLDLEKISNMFANNLKFNDAWFQVITKNGRSFKRSWSTKRGDNLLFRKDVQKVLKEKKVLQTISVGKFNLSFKTMIPLFNTHKEFIGIAETITHFNSIDKKLKNKNIQSIMLVDKSYSKIITYPMNKKNLGDYNVINRDAHAQYLDYLRKKDISSFINEIEKKGYFIDRKNNLFINYVALENIENKPMGHFFLFYPLNKIISNNTMILTPKEIDYLENKDNITMCIDPQWMPFESFDEENNYIGMSADYYKLFEEIVEKEFKVVQTSKWSESLEFAKERKCDILSLAMETPERKKYMNFTTPYLSIPLVVATKLDVPFINSIEDLRDKKIGITKGYAYAELLKNRYKDLHIIEVDNIDIGLQQVNEGELFGFIDTLSSVGYKFQNKFSGELKIAGKLDEKWELGVGVRNDDLVLLNIMQKLVQNITAEQEREILNKWISIKYEKGVDYKSLYRVIGIFLIVLALIIFWNYHISKQKKILAKKEKDLRIKTQEQENLLSLFEEGDTVLFRWNNDNIWSVNYVSSNVLNLLGYKQEEFVNKEINYISCIYKDDLAQVESEIDYVLSNKIKFFQHKPYRIVCKDNSIKWVLDNTITIKDENGEITDFLGYLSDISQLKAKDKLLLQQTKMSAMGDMIGNIAHQWRQPLSAISVSATSSLLKKEIGVLEDHEFVDSMQKINDHAQYLSQTIDTFRNFIKDDKEVHNLNIYDEISHAVRIISAALDDSYIKLIDNIDYTKVVNKEMTNNEFAEVIINIINNARDVIKEHNIKDGWICLDSKKEKNKLTITIEDNGGGIKEEVLNKIFEPYFTTKHQFQGTGLGLHMSYKIVTESLGGKIYASNTPNGALFTIEIPID